MHVRWKTVPVMLLCGGIACDAQTDRSYRGEVLATIHGRITKADVPTPPEVRVALAWYQPQASSSQWHLVTQDQGVRAQFPASFTLDVTVLPPESAFTHPSMHTIQTFNLDPNTRWASGFLVVYEDGNGNQSLDIVSSADQTSPDRILAVPFDYNIEYLEGTPFPNTGLGKYFPHSVGFQLVRLAPNQDQRPEDCEDPVGTHYYTACDPVPVGPQEDLAASTEIPIELTGSPELQHYACDRYFGAGEWADWFVYETKNNIRDGSELCDRPDCPFCDNLLDDSMRCPIDLPPSGAPVTCSQDRRAYVYKTCQMDASLCGTTVCHFGHWGLASTDPIPAGWPCL